ncbi:hypothetical protein ACFL3G_00460 [Planctomycetota bacterium]
MTVKIARKQIYKKCFVVLICLLMFGNLTHGAVLCFGSDGRSEIKSAFHERCDDHAHSQPTDQNQLSYQSDHVKDKHCEPCVDVPISISLAKISRVSKQLNSTFPAPAANVIVLAEEFNFGAYNLASSTFEATSYFTSLRTVILMV